MLLNAKHPLLDLSSQMATLCQPLEAFGIHHFTYLNQDKKGKRVSLSNKPAWIADYYNLNLYQSSLFEEAVETKHHFNLWFGDYELDVYQHGKLYYNTMHSISIEETNSEGCETYLFATTPDNAQAIHYLSNNREILYHFIMYLKDRGDSIFKAATKHAILIPEFTSTVPSEFNHSNHLAELEKQKDIFLAATPIRRFTFKDTSVKPTRFSQREITCIRHMLNYKTASEIAHLMNLSTRTIESYLNNIKTKLSCSSKAEAIQMLQNSPYWSAI